MVLTLLATLVALVALPPAEEAGAASLPERDVNLLKRSETAAGPVAPGSVWRALAQGAGAPTEPPESDPFQAGVASSLSMSPTAALKPEASAPPASLQVAAPPPPPQTRYRIAGWLAPQGNIPALWLLTDGEHELVVQAGTELRDGFSVRAISADGIRLRHGATGTEALLPLPSSPPPETSSSRRP